MAYYSTTDFNNDNYSYSDSESNSSEFKKQKKVLESMKRLDPDYFTVFRENKNPLKKKKWFKIELFKSSYNPKVRVRNAVTGIYESYKVGSNNSNIYFKLVNKIIIVVWHYLYQIHLIRYSNLKLQVNFRLFRHLRHKNVHYLNIAI